ARLAASGLPVAAEGGEFMTRELLKVGNREVYGADFRWVVGEWLSNERTPRELVVLERREWGNYYGFLGNVKEEGRLVAEGACVCRPASWSWRAAWTPPPRPSWPPRRHAGTPNTSAWKLVWASCTRPSTATACACAPSTARSRTSAWARWCAPSSPTP